MNLEGEGQQPNAGSFCGTSSGLPSRLRASCAPRGHRQEPHHVGGVRVRTDDYAESVELVIADRSVVKYAYANIMVNVERGIVVARMIADAAIAESNPCESATAQAVAGAVPDAIDTPCPASKHEWSSLREPLPITLLPGGVSIMVQSSSAHTAHCCPTKVHARSPLHELLPMTLLPNAPTASHAPSLLRVDPIGTAPPTAPQQLQSLPDVSDT